MELNRMHLAVGGALLLLAGGLAVGLFWTRSHSQTGSTHPGGKLTPAYGADTPEGVIKGVYAACQAGDVAGAAMYYVGGLKVKDLTPIKHWCDRATQNGQVKAWAVDETLTKSDGMGGLNMITPTWLDEAKVHQGPQIQWWLMKDGNRWVMAGGL